MPPSTPRRIWRPTSLPTVRAACLAIASTMPWRRLVPQNRSPMAPPHPARVRRRRRLGALAGRRLGPGAAAHRRGRAPRTAGSRGEPVSPTPAVRLPRISYADSRLTARVVLGADRAARPHGRPLLRRDRAHAAARRAHQRALHRHRHALVLQRRDQRLADAELRDHLRHVELRIGDERLGRRPHRLLVARRERAQRVLDAIAELAEDLVRHVVGKLRAEVHAHALRSDEPHDLLDALAQRRRRVVEQQVRLVEEEHQLRACRDRRLRAGSRTAPTAATAGTSSTAAA